jgi:hypothetical protein
MRTNVQTQKSETRRQGNQNYHPRRLLKPTYYFLQCTYYFFTMYLLFFYNVLIIFLQCTYYFFPNQSIILRINHQ